MNARGCLKVSKERVFDNEASLDILEVADLFDKTFRLASLRAARQKFTKGSRLQGLDSDINLLVPLFEKRAVRRNFVARGLKPAPAVQKGLLRNIQQHAVGIGEHMLADGTSLEIFL